MLNLNGIQLSYGMLCLITGRYKSGKTASCFYIAEQYMKNGDNVLFLEMENKFNHHSVIKSSNYHNMERILTNDELVRLFFIGKDELNFDDFFTLLESEINSRNIKLLIIDSYTFPFLISGSEIRGRQFGNMTTKFVGKLLNIAIKYNLLVITVHQKTEYDKQEEIKGGTNIGYIPNVIITTTKEGNCYYWNWHNFKIPFSIEDDGSIMKIG